VKHQNHKIIYLLYILIAFTILCIGCTDVITPTFPIITGGPTSGTILIEDGAETTFDRTPALTLYSKGADYMSFSGNGENWSEWVEYNIFYEDFNMVNNQNGTQFSSGIKFIYVRFKDENGKLSPSDNLSFGTINYEFKDLDSIKIIPPEVTMTIGSQYTFEVKGYDIDSSEVPLDGSQIIWVKCCGVGSLSNTSGLTTTYIAPNVSGERYITAACGPLIAGAKTIVVNKEKSLFN